MRLKTKEVINFIEIVISNDQLKSLFANVWMDRKSIFAVFLNVMKLSNQVSLKTFISRLNTVADSNIHPLHKKLTWNERNRCNDKWYLIASCNFNVGMLSRRCNRHITDINVDLLFGEMQTSRNNGEDLSITMSGEHQFPQITATVTNDEVDNINSQHESNSFDCTSNSR